MILKRQEKVDPIKETEEITELEPCRVTETPEDESQAGKESSLCEVLQRIENRES